MGKVKFINYELPKVEVYQVVVEEGFQSSVVEGGTAGGGGITED